MSDEDDLAELGLLLDDILETPCEKLLIFIYPYLTLYGILSAGLNAGEAAAYVP